MKKLTVLLVGAALLAGCADPVSRKLFDERDNAKTDAQKYQYLMNVSAGKTFKLNNGGIGNVNDAKLEYLKTVGKNLEPDNIKEDLIKKCFVPADSLMQNAICAYSFYVDEETAENRKREDQEEARREEEKHKMEVKNAKNSAQKIFRSGLQLTNANIDKYCAASARVAASVYAKAAKSGRLYDVGFDKIMLGISDDMYSSLTRKAGADTRMIMILRYNPEQQLMFHDMYELKCKAYPKEYMFNYNKIFH
ncbi:hypothetical protein PSI23_17540 [Xenorhabdus sp. XENO-10]|uniref:Lipoprotein n=1 Tax=Xenorhabdus yunnanensis TaxID=3025878 RepID=A0ABT5LJB2_9GAMM|nr:hypothetical protein [Xenorhabdus yunnanensis]MDC9591039.1 hypothetical protein [Xenorhabdus yunnanensis]